ncbi:class I SAM-dependent methyltransferase [Flavimaricola sp.]|nr:class I SAM-dependent methyltransferase [Flavimaricola sp.]MDA9020372.1 class I SAM-dependent methyltransferase [Flavimaricola sp.]
MQDFEKANIDYQAANSPSGGSYTEKKLKRLNLPNLEGKRFLDLGCNAGFHCRYAHAQGAERVMGVDNSPSVIKKAREQSDPTITFLDTGWDNFPNGTFDVVILLSAIHYAKNPRSVARNIRRSLSADGLLVLEGGLLFAKETRVTDIPLPGWRKVGDRCLHLTRGFLDKHLLIDYKWDIRGDSEMRGGDDVARYVMHAVAFGPEKENRVFDLDILDFFAAAAKSAFTIVPEQPAYRYVAPLQEKSNPDAAYVTNVLEDSETLELVLEDLAFSVSALECEKLRIHRTIGEKALSRISSGLSTQTDIELV